MGGDESEMQLNAEQPLVSGVARRNEPVAIPQLGGVGVNSIASGGVGGTAAHSNSSPSAAEISSIEGSVNSDYATHLSNQQAMSTGKFNMVGVLKFAQQKVFKGAKFVVREQLGGPEGVHAISLANACGWNPKSPHFLSNWEKYRAKIMATIGRKRSTVTSAMKKRAKSKWKCTTNC